jgi:hypothetical protein
LTKVFGEIVGDTLGTDENENLGVFGRDLFEVLDEPERNERRLCQYWLQRDEKLLV